MNHGCGLEYFEVNCFSGMDITTTGIAWILEPGIVLGASLKHCFEHKEKVLVCSNIRPRKKLESEFKTNSTLVCRKKIAKS